jgi:hypothetical protein
MKKKAKVRKRKPAPTQHTLVARLLYGEVGRHPDYDDFMDDDARRHAFCGIWLPRATKPIIFSVGETASSGPLLRPMCREALAMLEGEKPLALARSRVSLAGKPFARYGGVKTPNGTRIVLAGPKRELCEAFSLVLGIRLHLLTEGERIAVLSHRGNPLVDNDTHLL